MNIIDISWPLTTSTTAYKNKKTIAFESVKNFQEHNARETVITLSAHSGTHVDAPSHFLKDGKSIDTIPLHQLCGPCIVFDMTHIHSAIGVADVKKLSFGKHARILFKTRNSGHSFDDLFDPHFIYLTADAAEYLAQQHIAVIGIDYLGIERDQPNHETHAAFMKHDIAIIEGLRLSHVKPGLYQLICLPLAFSGIDAAPARCILIP